jgi:WASH complex subunit 7
MISESFEADLSSKLPVDAVVQKTLTTIQKHEELLHKIDIATRNTTSDAETHFRPIHIAMEPCERVYPQDMIVVGDNEHLRKVLIVLVFLCDEIHALQAIAANKFYPSLVMFGRSPIEIDSKDGDISDSAPYLKYPGNRERLIGLFMPTLQELANFVDRCHAVVLNLVQQLSSCYHNKGSGGLLGNLMGNNNTTQPALIAHLFSAIQALGEMLMVLVTLDHLVTQNEFLKESWAAFKGMIVYARADPLSFQTSDAHTTGT